MLKIGMVDFSMFALGTDLTDDHPVGIPYPKKRVGIDFNEPSFVKGDIAYYDMDGDQHADSDEIRFYKTGEGFEVECASCHDPHGVPAGAAGSTFIRSFLRVDNDNSQVCMTCHSL